MDLKKNRCCQGGHILVFSCSGASDIGELSDRTARILAKSGVAAMGCMAALSSKYDFVIDALNAASKIIIIDGCEKNCAKQNIDLAGHWDYDHYLLTDLGFEKGKAPATKPNIDKTTNIISSASINAARGNAS